MQQTHLFVGACVAAVAGALSGAAIDTTPLERGIDAWDYVPHQAIGASEYDPDAEPQALPDHYAILTPQGRFEVAELRDRGLYRNRRFGLAEDWPDDFEPAYEVAEADYRYLPEYESDPFASRAAPVTPDGDAGEGEPVMPALNAAPPAEAEPIAPKGQPRTIDVALALASRE